MIAGADPPPSDEPTFADVLNALTFGDGRRGRRRGRARRTAPQDPVPITVAEAAAPSPPSGWLDHSPEEATAAGDAVEDVAAIVRPYAWTRGRTRSTVELQVETLVSATETPGASAPPEHRTITELCRTPHSVAEVAAALDVPLGVAKVLISDLADAGLLTVHHAAGAAGPQAHLMLMERVLSGLRRL